MKLKTKLVPFLCAGAVAVIATPFALTSCGSKDDYIDLLTRYVPSGQQLDIENVTTTQACNMYLAAALENPDIIKQDYLWYASNRVIQVGKDNAKYHLLKIGNVACDEYEYGGYHVPLLSFTMQYKFEYTFPVDESTMQNQVYVGTSVYEKIPFGLSYDNVNHLWRFDWIQALLLGPTFSKYKEWSVKISYYQDNTFNVSDSLFGNYSYSTHSSNEYEYKASQVVAQTLNEIDRNNIIRALGEDGSYCSWYLYNLICMGD